MPRGSRLALCCLALLLSLSLYFKGRAPAVNGGDAALFRPAAGLIVRLAGDFPRPGLYRFPNGVSLQSAINLTLPDAPSMGALGGWPTGNLSSGDSVTLTRHGREPADVSVVRMRVKERMLLGVPLDPDLLRDEEWASLPGIGPVLAGRIVADRHKYGAFRSLEGLLRVPGIGQGKIDALRKYF